MFIYVKQEHINSIHLWDIITQKVLCLRHIVEKFAAESVSLSLTPCSMLNNNKDIIFDVNHTKII